MDSTTIVNEASRYINDQSLTLATFLSTIGIIILAALRQLAPLIIKRFQSRLEVLRQDDENRAMVARQEDQLAADAKAFLSEAAREQMSTIKTLAEECQDELRDMRKELLTAQVERAELRAKDEVRIIEINRISKELADTRVLLIETRETLEKANSVKDTLQGELASFRLELDRLRNQVTVLETRLQTEQQNNIALEKRLQLTEAELKVKDQLLAESKAVNETLRKDVRELQGKLKEYMNRVQTGRETADLLKRVNEE